MILCGQKRRNSFAPNKTSAPAPSTQSVDPERSEQHRKQRTANSAHGLENLKRFLARHCGMHGDRLIEAGKLQTARIRSP